MLDGTVADGRPVICWALRKTSDVRATVGKIDLAIIFARLGKRNTGFSVRFRGRTVFSVRSNKE